MNKVLQYGQFGTDTPITYTSIISRLINELGHGNVTIKVFHYNKNHGGWRVFLLSNKLVELFNHCDNKWSYVGLSKTGPKEYNEFDFTQYWKTMTVPKDKFELTVDDLAEILIQASNATANTEFDYRPSEAMPEDYYAI